MLCCPECRAALDKSYNFCPQCKWEVDLSKVETIRVYCSFVLESGDICGEEVLSNAPFCPQCGNAIKTEGNIF